MDPIKNLAEATLAAGIAADATTATLVTGEGTDLSTGGAYDLAIWNFSDFGDNQNAAKRAGKLELARVTRSGDTLTFVTRGLSPTTAIAHNESGKVYKVRQVPTKELFDQLAPKADGVHTGVTQVALLAPGVTDLGTVANTGTVTVTNATSKFTVTLTGTSNAISLPSLPPGDKRELEVIFTSGSAKTLTFTSLYRIDSPSLGNVTSVSFDATTTKAVLLFPISGSAFWGVAVLGDTVAIATSQLANVSAGNLDSGETDELARTVDVKAAIEAIESPNAVTASTALSTDNSLVRADGVSRVVQTSNVVVDDEGTATTPGDYVVEGEEAGSIQLSDADATSPETVTITAPEDIATSFVQQLPSAKGTGFLFGEVVGAVVVERWDHRTVTAGGTTGAQTINKPYGSVNFAAAATSLVVTNSLVTSSSVIVATVGTNDSTMKTVTAVAGTGSFTLYANAAATGETRVNFVVF